MFCLHKKLFYRAGGKSNSSFSAKLTCDMAITDEFDRGEALLAIAVPDQFSYFYSYSL